MEPPSRAAAHLFRTHIRRALFFHGAAAGLLWGLFGAGLCGMGLRFLYNSVSRGTLILAILGVAIGVATLAGLFAARHLPPLSACLAAVDAASRAGGLFMSSTLAGAEAWPLPTPIIPQVAWRGKRLSGVLLLAIAFCAVVVALPRRVFDTRMAERLSVSNVVKEVADQATLLEKEELLPAPTAAAFSNELAKISEAGDASDPARMMEALDHIQEEMKREAKEKAEALSGEQAELQAALALVSMLTERMENAPSPANPFNGANEALSQLLSNMKIPGPLASNLLASVSQAGALSPATLKELANLLKEAGAMNEAKLMKLSELKLVDASTCQFSSGSCTNAAACEAALAKMLGEQGPASEAAASLATLAGKPGSGGPSRGRGDAMLTWTDPSTQEHVKFKEEVLRPSRMPGANQARLEGVSAAAPEVAGTAAAVNSGALAAGGSARGVTPQTVILPRHKESVKRFFGNEPK